MRTPAALTILLLCAALPAVLCDAAAAEAQKLCTPERAAAIRSAGLVVRTEAENVFVNPFLWRGLKPKSQESLTLWAGHCLLERSSVSVRDVHSKREFARWSATLGYQPASEPSTPP